MPENVLKKDFKHQDIQRLRNLVQGKNGERTTTGIGYEKKKSFHEEGDVWEENGRTWKYMRGVKFSETEQK